MVMSTSAKFPIESGIYKTNGSCTEKYKRIKRRYSQCVKTFKKTFYHVYAELNVMK